MRRLLDSIIHIGLNESVPRQEERFVTLANALALVGILFSLLNIPFFLFDGEFYLLITVMANLPGLGLVFLLNARGWRLTARLHSNFFSLAQMSFTAFLIGIETRTHLFIFLVILAAFFQYPPWQKIYKYFTIVVASVVMVGLEISLYDYTPIVYTPPGMVRSGLIAILVNLIAFVVAFMYYNERVLNRAEARLEEEKERSEQLLRNILPEPIVARLKQSDEIIADEFPSASVLFADIVGFTELAARRTPESLIQLLNDIFSSFDQLVEKYDLEKIKTIGDAYMVVGGLPVPRQGHLQAICEFARDMLTRIESLAAEKNVALDLRIGIHTGPVAAGVIGLKKFSYDLWGDTVNTASRMESHGSPGKIHVSEQVQASLEQVFVFTDRREVAIKGKGPMTTYFLGEPF